MFSKNDIKAKLNLKLEQSLAEMREVIAESTLQESGLDDGYHIHATHQGKTVHTSQHDDYHESKAAFDAYVKKNPEHHTTHMDDSGEVLHNNIPRHERAGNLSVRLRKEAVATIESPPAELGDESGSEMSGYSQRMGIATKKFDKDNGSFTKKSERFGNGMVIYDYDK